MAINEQFPFDAGLEDDIPPFLRRARTPYKPYGASAENISSGDTPPLNGARSWTGSSFRDRANKSKAAIGQPVSGAQVDADLSWGDSWNTLVRLIQAHWLDIKPKIHMVANIALFVVVGFLGFMAITSL